MADRSEHEHFEWRSRHQYYAVTAANLMMLAHGTILGWISPAMPKLLSVVDNPLVTGPLSSSEISWIGSITNIGALCGALFFGYFTTLVGCKRAMICLAMPATAFWILVYVGDTYHHILLARFITGWTGGGINTTAVLYISEISNDKLRGRLGSFTQLYLNIGLLTAFIIGSAVDYKYIPYIFSFLPILYVICFVLLPNTPQYYLSRERNQEGENALKFYKNYKAKTAAEINVFNVEFERLKSIAENTQADSKLQLSDFTNWKALKGIFIGIALSYFVQLTGCYTVVTYSVYIFNKIGASVNPYVSSIILAAMLILGNLCTTQLADKLGRKTFMMISLFGSTIGMLVLSMYLYLSKIGYDLSSFAALPVMCLSLTIFISSAGIIPLSHVCRVENLPTKIRTIGLSICIAALNLIAFTCTKLFPILLESIEMHGCMLIFAVNSIFGCFFIYFVLDETRGKPMDVVRAPNKGDLNEC